MTHTRRMEGKRVLVTGSGTGIGRGVALEFAREGAAVVLHYAHSEAGAASAVDEIRSAGGTAEAFQADLADIEQVRALASQAIDFLGGLDVLVNNAGITMNKPFLQVTPEQFDTLYDVNIRGMYFLTQAAVPTMIEQGKRRGHQPDLGACLCGDDRAHDLRRHQGRHRRFHARPRPGTGDQGASASTRLRPAGFWSRIISKSWANSTSSRLAPPSRPV